MEEEVRCLHCDAFYHVPVLLGCRHALCLSCAITLQKPSTAGILNGHCPEEVLPPSSGVDDHQEPDKISVLSDADSGVSSCSSRPTSIAGENGVSNSDSQRVVPHHGTSLHSYTIKCPKCDLITTLDESGSEGLPRYRVLAAVVDKYLEKFHVAEPCQLCEDSGSAPGDTSSPANIFCDQSSTPRNGPRSSNVFCDQGSTPRAFPRPAHYFCDQCLVFYCSSCRETCHPSRGPLADHWLVSVAEGRALLRARRREREGKCGYHPSESVSMYCITCRFPVCVLCLHHGRHHSHDVHALNAVTKSLKTELSQSLQQLSEKAKGATEFIHTLKSLQEEVQGSCSEVEGVLVAQIDALQTALQERRTTLINWLRQQRDRKVHTLKDQAQEYTQTLQSTTGTIQFCIEALKEADPTAFMESQDVLEEKVSSLADNWSATMNPEPRTSPSFDLTLDDKSLLTSIQQLTFVQLKPPGSPSFVPSECSAENNSVTVCWTPHLCSVTAGYLLEIDDGADGHFKEVYSGQETVCTIDGLHFNSLYRVRVRAFNGTGISPYSDILCLQTAEVAWFVMNSDHSDLDLNEEEGIISCDSFEHRVALGSVGFSRGSHFWKYDVVTYDGKADVAFGVARKDIDKEMILGKCPDSWSMYIDSERSWLMHGGEHFRRSKGGIQTGDTVGILLSWEDKSLYFFLNDSLKGTVVLNAVTGVLVPAISLNRSVSLRLRTGLELPKYFSALNGMKHISSSPGCNSL